jgi:uncharacterized membrane protein
MANDPMVFSELQAKVWVSEGSLSARIAEVSTSKRSQPVSLGNRTVILLLVTSNVLGNFTLSRGLHQVGRLVSFSPWPYIHAFLNPLVATGVFLLIAWLILQLSLLSRADLSYVLPITSMSYVVTALMGKFLLHEPVSIKRWIGIGLIVAGIGLVSRTLPRTTPASDRASELPNNPPCEVAQ